MNNNLDLPISYLFHEINKMFINNVKTELEKIGINPTYRFIFHVLTNNSDGVNQSEICKYTHLKAPSISLTLQQMENEGLIVKEKSKSDSRSTIVKLTSKGYQLDNKLKEIFKKYEDNIINSLTKEELGNLLVYIDKIKNSLKGENDNV